MKSGDIEKIEARFFELCSKTFEEQAQFFLTRMGFDLDLDTVKKVFAARDSFQEANDSYWTNHRGSFTQGEEVLRKCLPLSSTQTTRFLESQKTLISHIERPNHFEELTDEMGHLSFIGFLLYNDRAALMRQHFQRRHKRWPKGFRDLRGCSYVGVEKKGYELNYKGERKLVGFCLKEELFKPPFGHDEVLDMGLYEFDKIMEPRLRHMHDLLEVIETESGVKQVKAKNQLVSMEQGYSQALLETEIRIKSYVDKLYAKQESIVRELIKQWHAEKLRPTVLLEELKRKSSKNHG
mmetsp:Transcript_3575/g.4497  ORF Transcript_3575/g.4497 Transcript_3575/m.4497 type:complete len:294 (+) Transcript_3575:346-1227(+)|eukprot:CAMPEP_0204839888 /NCGR_PEP_ID=MMETSP1346-20131115/35795_1 /ASSEMBLY_ACC=CAM_ASM_000771 /TAXON_ID=215587 /ORGANISM="Aplanochytrium stocchinoi, Strain GSBS06" /LENGTH=293 /DNA_ID=CAMNT_0051976955 /DNA_START=250 /DNA_END=1131 /DNA_ORIENTATION=+